MTLRRIALAIAWVLVTLLGGARSASAHAMRSGYVEIVESATGAAVRLRTTVRGTGFAVVKPAGCSFEDGSASLAPDPESLMTHAEMRCDGPLAGRTLVVRGLRAGLGEIVVLHERPDGQRSTALLRDVAEEFVFPSREPESAFGSYVRLGVQHIAGGLDHLLFLLLLVLTLRRVRDVLVAETAFTISHSISFSLTATGLLRVPSAPTELLIALSIVLMAFDVPRRLGGGATTAAPSPRSAAALAFVFGVVHGLGFAGGLREIGLPDRQIGGALVGFAVGVEAGQLLFVAAVMLAGAAVARVAKALARQGSVRLGEEALVVLAGGYASLLVLERTMALLRA